MKFDNLLNDEGSALVISLVVMLSLTLMATAALQISNINIRVARNYREGVQANYAAAAGVEKMFDAFKQGDTNGDGSVNGADTVNASNDLDGDNTIDFTQVWVNRNNIGDSANRIAVNSGDTRAFIWVDASQAPVSVTVYSKGNPSGTKGQRELAQSMASSGSSVINGAVNNAP